MKKSVGYHTRLYGQNSVKASGGSFGGALDLETANRLVTAHFSVTVKPSGTPVFVDRQGREVSLYMSIDPAMTDAGKIALASAARARVLAEEREEEKRQRIESLLDGMSLDDALKRLE